MDNKEVKPNFFPAIIAFFLISLLPMQPDEKHLYQFFYQLYLGALYCFYFLILYKLEIYLIIKSTIGTAFKILYHSLSIALIFIFYLLIQYSEKILAKEYLLYEEVNIKIILILAGTYFCFSIRN